MTSRRTFLATVTSGLFAAPLAAWAQQAGKVYRIGFVWDSPTVWPHALEAFRQGLRDLAWVEGQNIIVEYRWAEGRFDRKPDSPAMHPILRSRPKPQVLGTAVFVFTDGNNGSLTYGYGKITYRLSRLPRT